MGIARTIRRARRLLAQVMGGGVGLVGVFFLLISLPPQDLETGVVFGIGLLLLGIAYGMITNPEKVRFGNRRHRDDEDERRRGRRRNRP